MPHVFADGEVLTGQNVDNYLNTNVIKTVRLAGSPADTTVTGTSETVVDTVTNLLTAAGSTINRAVRIDYGFTIAKSSGDSNTQRQLAVRAYYQAAATFTLASATLISTKGGDLVTDTQDYPWHFTWVVSLAPNTTYSFGFTFAASPNGVNGFVIRRDGSQWDRQITISDIGEGSLVT